MRTLNVQIQSEATSALVKTAISATVQLAFKVVVPILIAPRNRSAFQAQPWTVNAFKVSDSITCQTA